MKVAILAALLLFWIHPDALSQSRKGPIPLSLTAEQMYFRKGENTKVKLTFENRTGKKIPSVDYLGASLILQRTSSRNRDCHWDDCYLAFFVPKSTVELPDRGSFEAEIDLADLHWVDLIDSNSRIGSPEKNFFTKIISGNFNLIAELHHSLDLWKEDDPRFIKNIESNRILLAIENERKIQK